MILLLSDILRVFSFPIKEEQAWSVCYSTAKILNEIIESGGKVNQLCEENLGFKEDGEIFIQSSPSEQLHDLSEAELIESLGVVLVKSLNYGLHPDHPLSISDNLDSLLLHMTSTLSHDEGVVSCSILSFEDVISACSSRISNDCEQCDEHYRTVCKSMLSEAVELKTFLDVVGSCKENDDGNLESGDWAKIWLSVMSELRHGVKLKHLEPSSLVKRPREYQLTPFEVLLTDIRSRRYRLNQVMVNGEIPPSVRKSAESLILDYIKSRPPLRAAPVNVKKPPRPLTAREMLLTAIRNSDFHLKPTPSKPVSSHSTKASNATSTSSGQQHQHRRKVIKIDQSRFTADSDPEDDCSSSTSSSHPQVETTEATPVVIPQIKKLRTIAMTRSRSLSPPPEIGARADKVVKPETIVEPCNSPAESEPDIQMEQLSPSPVSQKCPLTFEELSRIRSVLTAAELEQLAVCPHVQSDVAAGRVCFTCRKVRFNLIHWANRCRLCGWNVCQKCVFPSVFLPGFDRGVPACCDCCELLDMLHNPKSPASSLSPSESGTIQNSTVDSNSTTKISNDQSRVCSEVA